MTDRKQYHKEYYRANSEKIKKRAKEAHQNAVANKAFGTLLNELADSRIKLEAAMLQDVLKDFDIKLDHIALLWKEYQQKTNAYVVMSNVEDHKQPFINWVESR